jgi:hypothetical protein
VDIQLHSFFDLGTRWRWVVSFTTRPLYSQGKNPRYKLDRRLAGPQSRSGCGGEEKNSQPPPGIEIYLIYFPLHQLLRIGSSALFRLRIHWHQILQTYDRTSWTGDRLTPRPVLGQGADPYETSACTEEHKENVDIRQGVSISFRTESITRYTLTKINTRWEATQRIMAAKLTRLTHKIAIQLQLVAESCAISSSSAKRPVRKLLDTPSYLGTNDRLTYWNRSCKNKKSRDITP